MSNSQDNTVLLSMFMNYDKSFQSKNSTPASMKQSNKLNFSSKINISQSSTFNASTATSPDKNDNPYTFSSILNVTRTPNEDERRVFKRKLDEKKEDLLQAQAKILCLENNLRSPQPELKAKVLELEKDIEKYKLQYIDEKNKTEGLRRQIASLLEKNELYHEGMTNLENKYSDKCKEYEAKLKLEKNCFRLLQEKYDSLLEQIHSLNEAQNKNKSLESQLLLSQEKSIELENRLQNLSKILKERNSKIFELETQLDDANHTIMVQNNKLGEIEDQTCLQVALKDEIAKLPELKEKLSYYQDKVADLEKITCNTFLLQEKIHDLEGHLERERSRLENYNETLVENETLKKKLQDWEALFNDDETKKTPSSISRRIQDLQKSELLLTENIGELKSEIHLMESKLEKLEKTNTQMKTECEKHQKQLSENINLTRKLQKRLLLVSNERDSFKRILDSYENEVTTNITVNTKERLASMERLLNNYKQALQQSGIDPETCPNTNQEDNKEMAAAITKLKNDLMEKDSELKQLKEKLGLKLKVIHAMGNPLEKAHQKTIVEYKKLKEENMRLLAKIKHIEASGSADVTGDITANISIGTSKEKAASLELKCRRLMESFNKKSTEFREACYLLTGYRIDAIQQNKYKLTCMYAESSDDYLIFERDNKKGLLLLETEYSTKLIDLINTYLKDHDSIPAFLSSITMNLFKQQTYIHQ